MCYQIHNGTEGASQEADLAILDIRRRGGKMKHFRSLACIRKGN